jgi:hypothetical protein
MVATPATRRAHWRPWVRQAGWGGFAREVSPYHLKTNGHIHFRSEPYIAATSCAHISAYWAAVHAIAGVF